MPLAGVRRRLGPSARDSARTGEIEAHDLLETLPLPASSSDDVGTPCTSGRVHLEASLVMSKPIGTRRNASHLRRLVGVRGGLEKLEVVWGGCVTMSPPRRATGSIALERLSSPDPPREPKLEGSIGRLEVSPCVADPPRDRGPGSKPFYTRVSQLEAPASGRDLRRPPRSTLDAHRRRW